GWLVNRSEILQKTKLKKVHSISINQIASSRSLIDLYRDRFSATLVSMEGAALHYCCLQEHIPFLQLRSVSNYTGERNKKNWKMSSAISNLNTELIQFIDNL